MENAIRVEWASRYSDTMEDDDCGRWARVAYAGIFDEFGFVDGKASRWEIAWILKVPNVNKFQIKYNFPSVQHVVYDDLEDVKKKVEENFNWFIKSCVGSNNFKNELSEDCDSLSIPDIRNKLTPFKNLLALLKVHQKNEGIDFNSFILKEMEQCEKSIEYLSKTKKS